MTVSPSSLPAQRLRAVLFDLDDTLIASRHLESFRLHRDHQGLEAALPGLSAPAGLHAQLRRLSQHLPLGIVTTAPRWYAERLLSHLYPDIKWQALITYGDVQRRKPDPQGLLLAVSRLNMPPSVEVAYIGDQATDLEAARRAGLLPVQATWCLDDAGVTGELSLKRPEDLDCFIPAHNPASAAGQELLTLLQLHNVGKSSVLTAVNETNLGLGQSTYSDRRILTALEQPGAWERAAEAAQAIMDACLALGVRIVSIADPEYPQALHGMIGKEKKGKKPPPENPPLLYVQGVLSPRPGLAVIGTREPTQHGLEMTRRMVTHFSATHSIVSGLALGVDSMAHLAAMQAGGHTVAVLGHGHGRVFPRQNAGLAEAILEGGGALVSEYAPGTDVKPYQFVERDRIQAGLAGATIMVQTGLQGGSWHAARKTITYGRTLGYPVPTERDVANLEDKVQGILLLERGTTGEKTEQLNCQEADLSRIYRISGKEDYSAFALRAVHG